MCFRDPLASPLIHRLNRFILPKSFNGDDPRMTSEKPTRINTSGKHTRQKKDMSWIARTTSLRMFSRDFMRRGRKQLAIQQRFDSCDRRPRTEPGSPTGDKQRKRIQSSARPQGRKLGVNENTPHPRRPRLPNRPRLHNVLGAVSG